MSAIGGMRELVIYWIEKARECLDSARDEKAAGRGTFSVNRLYYACFYAASAALLSRGLEFKKHSGVRASFHQNLVKTGMVSLSDGELYDELFDARQRGDYLALVSFSPEQIEQWTCRVPGLVQSLSDLAR